MSPMMIVTLRITILKGKGATKSSVKVALKTKRTHQTIWMRRSGAVGQTGHCVGRGSVETAIGGWIGSLLQHWWPGNTPVWRTNTEIVKHTNITYSLIQISFVQHTSTKHFLVHKYDLSCTPILFVLKQTAQTLRPCEPRIGDWICSVLAVGQTRTDKHILELGKYISSPPFMYFRFPPTQLLDQLIIFRIGASRFASSSNP